MNLLKTSLAILFLSSAFTAFSQTELKNIVLHGETFLPLESASVYVQKTTIGTITNSDGKFALVVPPIYARPSYFLIALVKIFIQLLLSNALIKLRK